MTKPKEYRSPAMRCPHCNSRALVRSSKEDGPMIRDIRFVCDNDECGHTFLAQLAIVRTIRPSACPNPEVRLPFANPNIGRQGKRPANDDGPLPANDDDIERPAAEFAP